MAKGVKTGGRKKGTPNKLNASVKEAIVNAFHEVGGAKYLVGVAKENPAVFCQLVGKVLPLQVGGDEDNPVKIEFAWATSRES
jgi:hypothetical protein